MWLRSSFIYFLIILSSISVSLYSSSSDMENDRVALLALKEGFTGSNTLLDENNVLNIWNSSVHFCEWEGITCETLSKRVVRIALVAKKLNGFISPWIGNLSHLRGLYLNNNSLHGEIPKQVGNLYKLQYLNLQNNTLEGQIPTELSNCSDILYMNLNINELTGRIPFKLGSLPRITVFKLERNNFVGQMPTFLMNMSSLTHLYIGYNKLHGDIRDSLQGLTNLEKLSIHRNSFTGLISYIYNLSSLSVLELDRNNLTGTLSPHIDNMFPKLTWLSLYANDFSGTIPPALFNITGLYEIVMSSNHFEGSIPDAGRLKNLRAIDFEKNNLGGNDMSNDLRFIDSLTNCTNFELLSGAYNRFVGPIPNSVGNLSSNIQIFGLSNNYITGAIPDGIGKLSSMTWIDLSGNMLTGTIPDSVGELSYLVKLVLFSNKLHGAIPTSLGKLTHLYWLDLSQNSLSASVPTTFHNCTSMQVFSVSNNHLGGYLSDDVFNQWEQLTYFFIANNFFGGSFPSAFGSIRTLNVLEASNNNFDGQIPSQLSESLEILHFAGNSFQGNIPVSMGNLKSLIMLDLSRNNLSGTITKELASLELLQNVDLSFNELEGEVPRFKNVSQLLVAGNSKLCGGNPELQLRPCPLNRTKKNTSKKVIIIAAVVSTVGLLSLFVTCFIFFYLRKKQKKENTDNIDERYQRITYFQLFKATEGFAETNLIGKGSFGDVFKGFLDGNERNPVAVKVLKLSKHGAHKSFLAECKVLRSIRHRNLLRIITSCSSLDHNGNDFKALVFDYMSNGNLDSWLHISYGMEARISLTIAMRLQIALDVACALNYLHNYCKPPIVHCDLKPSNILLDDDMVAHVGDFGLAKLLCGNTENIGEAESLSTAIRGTVGYVAPEYGMGAAISPQGDTYSYGILLLELITGKRPTDEMFNNEMNIRNFVKRAQLDHIEEVVDECLVNELHETATLQTNPEQYILQWRSFIVSLVEVGISCCAESSRDRMDIQSAIKCLTSIKEKDVIVR